MSATGIRTPARRSLRARWFEPRTIRQMAPATAIVVYTLLILWAAFVLFPLYWVVITSVKEPIAVNNGPVYLPWVDFTPSLHAWRELFVDDYDDTVRAYINSIIISLSATALCITVGSLAAYALTRLQYRPRFASIAIFVICTIAVALAVSQLGVDLPIAVVAGLAVFLLLARAIGRRFKGALNNNDVLFWMISQRILPPIVSIIPIYMMFQTVRLLDTHIAQILTLTVVNLPIVVWLMHDFLATIPTDLDESAQLDGATRFRTFFEIIMPLAKPGLAATTLLVLILCWNEYLLSLILSTSNAQTMPILVAAMNAGEKGVLWWTMAVVIVVMIIPVVLMALLLQRFISKGVLLGAVKG